MTVRLPTTKDTTWNQHNGVGVTLMDNWVEERAVGAERIIKERNVRHISERGHLNILVQDHVEDPTSKYNTISRMSYMPSPSSASRRNTPLVHKGKYMALKEKKWSMEAALNLQPKTEVEPIVYQSTTAASYFDPEFESSMTSDKLPPSIRRALDAGQPLTDLVSEPMTFWSHQMARGGHTVYGSTPHGVNPYAGVRAAVVGYSAVDPAELEPPHSPIRDKVAQSSHFGRKSTFSTPIAENLKSHYKE